MIINFLYCIDFPNNPDIEKSDQIRGWLLCSNNIIHIQISDASKRSCSFEYGLSRPDVAQIFKGFPNNEKCGFTIIAEKEPINLRDEFVLELEVETKGGESKKLFITLDLNSSGIQEIEVDDNKAQADLSHKITEEKLKETLKKHPWITIRMDITNKCNLRCIMCHYKEEEIHSRPTKNITAEQLKHNLKDIAPYVKHIMLSCGFEPLMSKHFAEIVSMIHDNFPHMEIAMCTNGMLLGSKARKTIIENNVTHLLLSLDGVTKKTVERIRVGADYNKIIGNIMALRDLKQKHKRNFPLMFMDFVLMNSNIHEAPAFVQLCSKLGIEIIDFRHMVGNVYFSEHEEMLTNHKEKYNYYRKLIIDESKKFRIKVRLPEPFETEGIYVPEVLPEIDLADFNNVSPDVQTEEIIANKEMVLSDVSDSDFSFLSQANCLRPFNEIMIIDQEKILPCSYYCTAMGHLDENNSLYSIFFNEKYQKVRQKKMQSRFDHNCLNCPIKMNQLPTDIVR
jgi:molybdenum cofactor biosynthesis enzyme MoaA